jgi:3-hydroxyisobutyrate dehydrogenase-like beta-hydroxyacid dehydrogenase
MMEGWCSAQGGSRSRDHAFHHHDSSGNSNACSRAPSPDPRNFEPGFKVQLMNKDLDTFNSIARELHVPVSLSNIAQRYQQTALAAGLAEKDTSVIFTIIESLAGIGRK